MPGTVLSAENTVEKTHTEITGQMEVGKGSVMNRILLSFFAVLRFDSGLHTH